MTMKYLMPLLFCLAVGLGACSQAMPQGGSSMAAALILTDAQGQYIPLGQHLGREVVVVNFWATFCKPCQHEMPFLQRLHETYGAKGLYLLMVSTDGPDSEAQVLPLLQRNGYTFPVAVDRSSEASTMLNPKGGLPHLVVFDRSGREVLRKDGVLPGEEAEFEAFLKGLL